jgi:hypothetical protein
MGNVTFKKVFTDIIKATSLKYDYEIIRTHRNEWYIVKEHFRTGHKTIVYNLCSDWPTLKSAKNKVIELINLDNGKNSNIG